MNKHELIIGKAKIDTNWQIDMNQHESESIEMDGH